MSNGFLGRLARKWWLMLMVGIVVGLGVGIPLQGVLPGSLVGETIVEVDESGVWPQDGYLFIYVEYPHAEIQITNTSGTETAQLESNYLSWGAWGETAGTWQYREKDTVGPGETKKYLFKGYWRIRASGGAPVYETELFTSTNELGNLQMSFDWPH